MFVGASEIEKKIVGNLCQLSVVISPKAVVSNHFDSNRQISLVFDIILFNDKSYINNKSFNIFYFIVKYHKKIKKNHFTIRRKRDILVEPDISKIKHGARN